MAKYNEILVGRFNRALQKLTGIKGGPVAPQLAGEISATLAFPIGVEFRYLEQWGRFAVELEQAAVAAQTTAFRFRNPAGSNVIAVIERLALATNPAGLINITSAPNVADLPTVLNGNAFLDVRGNPKANIVTSEGNNVADLSTLLMTWSTSAVSVFSDALITDLHEFAISPGQTMQVTARTVNSAMLGDFIWRERILEEAERI